MINFTRRLFTAIQAAASPPIAAYIATPEGARYAVIRLSFDEGDISARDFIPCDARTARLILR